MFLSAATLKKEKHGLSVDDGVSTKQHHQSFPTVKKRRVV